MSFRLTRIRRVLADPPQEPFKALTPVEMEWCGGVMMGDDQSFRNLSAEKPPFYARPDFLK